MAETSSGSPSQIDALGFQTQSHCSNVFKNCSDDIYSIPYTESDLSSIGRLAKYLSQELPFQTIPQPVRHHNTLNPSRSSNIHKEINFPRKEEEIPKPKYPLSSEDLPDESTHNQSSTANEDLSQILKDLGITESSELTSLLDIDPLSLDVDEMKLLDLYSLDDTDSPQNITFSESAAIDGKDPCSGKINEMEYSNCSSNYNQTASKEIDDPDTNNNVQHCSDLRETPMKLQLTTFQQNFTNKNATSELSNVLMATNVQSQKGLQNSPLELGFQKSEGNEPLLSFKNHSCQNMKLVPTSVENNSSKYNEHQSTVCNQQAPFERWDTQGNTTGFRVNHSGQHIQDKTNKDWPNVSTQSNNPHQSEYSNQLMICQLESPFVIQNLDTQYLHQVKEMGKQKTNKGEAQTPAHKQIANKAFPNQQFQTVDQVGYTWRESKTNSNVSNTEHFSKKMIESLRPSLITNCHLEEYDKFSDLTLNQFKQICPSFDGIQRPVQKTLKQGRDESDFKLNQILQIYNSTTHGENSTSDSPSHSLSQTRKTVIRRNSSILGKRTEEYSNNECLGDKSELNGQTPCKIMKLSLENISPMKRRESLLKSQEINYEVMDCTNNYQSPSTSSANVTETPLMGKLRSIRNQLDDLLEAIDSVILQKGVKEKSPRTEEWVEDDIYDEKRLKKSFDTLSSYYIEACDLFKKFQQKEITKEDLLKEAKRLKNKFSGMKSRVKKKKESIGEKKEFFKLLHEFKLLKAFSQKLETFQKLVVQELGVYDMPSPLGQFISNTVFSQFQTFDVDSWIDKDISENVKK